MTSAPVRDLAPPSAAYPLFGKQMDAMRAIWLEQVDQLLYGGSAGPGKSYWLRALAWHCANSWPGARIPIFRDNYTQLKKTQVAAFHSEMARLGYRVKDHWNATDAEWHIPNPYTSDTIIEFLHIDPSIGAEKWLSAEWACVMADEATQITEDDHQLLYTRVRAPLAQRTLWTQLADEREANIRAAGIEDPFTVAAYTARWHPFAAYASNPGGASHEYFKRQWVDEGEKRDGRSWETSEQIMLDGRPLEVRLRRKFVQAYLTDNPNIDPLQYARGLAHLPTRRREQLLSGNWQFFEGKVFDMLDERVHYVDHRPAFLGRPVPPSSWPRLGGLDHGTTSPTAAEWMTRDEDNFFIAGYLEYYSPGPVGTHIRSIRNLLTLDGKLNMLFEADPRMWHRSKGTDRMWSVADEYTFGGEPPQNVADAAVARQRRGINIHQSQVERIAGRMVLERLLEPDPDLVFPHWHPMAGQHGAPRLFISRAAPNLWRELNGVRFVDSGGDRGEETVKEDDHAFDACYRVASSFELALAHRPQYRPAAQIGYR